MKNLSVCKVLLLLCVFLKFFDPPVSIILMDLKIRYAKKLEWPLVNKSLNQNGQLLLFQIFLSKMYRYRE